MRSTLLILLVLAPTASAGAEWTTLRQAVVYGEDDRVRAEEHPSALYRSIAERSVAAVVDSDRIDESGSVAAQTLGDSLDLCEGERFSELPSLARCTGVLVGEDLVMTAGHCMENVAACESRVFVFDWSVTEGEVDAIDESNVYACERILAVDTRGYANLRLDYAVVRLDRAVDSARSPVPIRAAPAVLGESVVLISHPGGVPVTIDSGGQVRDSRSTERDFFVVDTDSFEGSSGGPVLDAEGQLLGILVRGADDYERDGPCLRVRIDDMPSEEVTQAAWIVRALCASTRHLGLCEGRDGCGVLCEGARCVEECEDSATPEWTCVDELFAANDGCDCGCGVPDPDCEQPYDFVWGCESGQWCDSASECTQSLATPLPGWECNPVRYGDGVCDCGCGLEDVDCTVDECAPARGAEPQCGSAPRAGAGCWLLVVLLLITRRTRIAPRRKRDSFVTRATP